MVMLIKSFKRDTSRVARFSAKRYTRIDMKPRHSVHDKVAHA